MAVVSSVSGTVVSSVSSVSGTVVSSVITVVSVVGRFLQPLLLT